MNTDTFRWRSAGVLALATLIASGCCGADIVDEQVDRTDVDGFYRQTPGTKLMMVDIPSSASAGEPQTKTVVATDVTVTVQGSVVTLDFVADNHKYTYTYNMQESPRATIVSP